MEILAGWPLMEQARSKESLAEEIGRLRTELDVLREAAMSLLNECEGDIPPSLGALAKLNEALKRDKGPVPSMKIIVGHTYLLRGATGSPLKPKRVVSFNRGGPLLGGNVQTKSVREDGSLGYGEGWSGDYFLRHIIRDLDAQPEQ